VTRKTWWVCAGSCSSITPIFIYTHTIAHPHHCFNAKASIPEIIQSIRNDAVAEIFFPHLQCLCTAMWSNHSVGNLALAQYGVEACRAEVAVPTDSVQESVLTGITYKPFRQPRFCHYKAICVSPEQINFSLFRAAYQSMPVGESHVRKKKIVSTSIV
jgi:hypothetical protein